MKIDYIKGDLFTSPYRYILHGCNSKGVMGSGVARAVKELYPKAFEEYSLWCSKGFRLGQFLAVDCGDATIINAVTQQNYGKAVTQLGPNPERFVSYDAVAQIMSQINKTFSGETIAMPTIGAALGGGKWEVISAIIETELTTVKPVVYTL